jgi:hypothetical protein
MVKRTSERKPNYRFQYQVRLYCDGRMYNSIPVDIDFFAKDNEKAREHAKKIWKDFERKDQLEQNNPERSEHSPNDLYTLVEKGQELKRSRRVEVNFYKSD